jgi:serine/threonine protein phosphatase PrpC
MSAAPLQQAKVYADRDMEAAESFAGLGGDVVVFTARSPAKNGSNEDSFGVIPHGDDGGVLVIADGVGGAPAGEQASRIAVQCVRKAAADARDSDALLRTVILNGIEAANRSILDLGVGAATTFVAVEVLAGVIRPYHIGDSTAVVIGQRGKVKLQTVAHAPISQAVEAGVIDDHEAMHHEDRHVVSNVLGADDMRIEIGPSIRLSRFDTVLLASDGLFDNLSLEHIVARVRKGSLLEAVEQLVSDARERMGDENGMPQGKPDDLTIVAFRLGM